MISEKQKNNTITVVNAAVKNLNDLINYSTSRIIEGKSIGMSSKVFLDSKPILACPLSKNHKRMTEVAYCCLIQRFHNIICNQNIDYEYCKNLTHFLSKERCFSLEIVDQEKVNKNKILLKCDKDKTFFLDTQEDLDSVSIFVFKCSLEILLAACGKTVINTKISGEMNYSINDHGCFLQ